MAKKKEAQTNPIDVEVTAGGRRVCPDCKLQFRVPERFDEHRAFGCKPAKSTGPTFSEKDPEAIETPVEPQS